VDSSGNVFVGDYGNNKIRKIDVAGVVTTLAGSGNAGSTNATGAAASFNQPRGVAVDGSGNIYVADTGNNKIRKVTSGGVVTTLAGSGIWSSTDATGAAASFGVPQGVAVDGVGNVYVADTGNYMIRKITASGIVTSLAGHTGVYGNIDDTGSSARLEFVNSVTVNASGRIYVADDGNNNIRKGVAVPAQTINFGSISNRPYSTTGFTVIATASSGLTPVFSIFSGPATLIGSTITLTGVGTVVVRASQSGNANFAAAPSVDQSFTVTQASQTITFGTLANKTYGNSAFVVSATSSSLLAPAFSIVSGPATLSGSTLILTGAGNVTVRASQSGNNNYLAAPPVDQSFTVAQATQTISFSLINRTYGDSPFAASATASSGLPPSFSIVSGPASIAGSTINLTGAGAVTVRASQAGNTNYLAAAVVDVSFTVAKANATVTLSNLFFAYDGSPKAASATTLPVGLAVGFTYAGNSNPPTLGGNYALVGTINDSNYQGSASSTFVIGYTLHLSASHGTIAGATNGDIKPTGTLITLTATPSAGYFFANWTGDVTGGSTRTNPLNVTMSADKAITANFFQNLATPTNLYLSKTYFYDNVATGTVVGQLSATDADVGDFISYSLVAGPGNGDTSDRDNARFSILNNDLKTSTNLFNYDIQRTQLIRIRATDLAGHSVETAFVLNLVDATPWASFELKNGFTNAPSYVNVIYQLKDTNGNGINLPRELFDQANTIFQVKENGSAISPTESFAQVKKIDQVPAKVRTILLLDNSFSVGANLPTIKTAAKALVDSMFDQQEIAVYSFSGGYTLIKDFTSKSTTNQQALKTAIDTINLGSPSTDLYGTIIAMLNLPQWVESFSLAGIQTGFLIVLTDGSDTAGQATLDEVTTLRDAVQKKIFTVGLGAEIDTNALIKLGNAGYKPAAQVSAVATNFAAIQNSIVDSANSYYWLNYASPKRGNFNRTLTVGLTNNANLGANSTLTYIFNSSSFQDVAPGVMINRNVNLTYGVTNLTIPKDTATTALAFTMLGFFGTPAYTWNAGNSNLVALAPLGTNGSSVIINPVGSDGTTTLTLIDTVNFYTNTIPLIIGTGIALPSQFITFAPLADRATTSAAFNLSAAASSGLPVSFSILSGPATLSSNTVTLAGVVGTVVVRATQAGNTNFAIATAVDRSFVVTVPGYNQIASKILSGGQVRLAFVGNAGANYALDRSFKLSPPTWIPQVTNPADANGVLVFTNAPNASTNNFWRIRSVP
jgi:sugar lactone lactonase YvrE